MIGEDALELLSMSGIAADVPAVARDEKGADELATAIGYPLVMKVVSPDALHKTDAGGVMVGVRDEDEVRRCFTQIRQNLHEYKQGARFEGVSLPS